VLAINTIPASCIPHFASTYANLSSELYFEIVINERDRFLRAKARSYGLLSVFLQKKNFDTVVAHFTVVYAGKCATRDKTHNFLYR